MLAGCLLVALLALPVSSLVLFTPFARRAQHRIASTATVVVIACVAGGVAAALGTVAAFAAVGAAALVAVSLAWAPAIRPWSGVGRAAWAAAVLAGALYLVYMLEWTFRSRLGPVGTAGALLLWGLEAAAYLLGLAFLWEMVDVLATPRWQRRITDPSPEVDEGAWPYVSLHVPAHNEPPEMVIETLQSLLALDYPADRLQIVMVDDNTNDTALWHPVADFCATHRDRISFHHLDDWPGFKSGALNFALTVTDPRAEIVGVVDADYLVDGDYLSRCAPLFVGEPRLAFVQTPQDYRDWEQAAYYRRLYYSYSYFFAVSQVSRNERDGAIFGGTMGLIRRAALTQVGGWDEWCITEDAELSLRLLRAGWSGRHIDRSFGRGIMPLTFDALKRQRFRWCFGGIQILRMHWRSLLPWNRAEDNHLTMAQRLAYLSGAVQWYGDLLGLAFTAFLLVASLDLGLGGGLVFRRLSGFLLAAVPALVLLNLTRALAMLRRATGASRRDAIGAFGIWLALGWTVAAASVRGAVAPAGVFLRTPKTRGDANWSDALRANRPEALLAGLGSLGVVAVAASVHGPGRWLLSGLLLLPVAGALAAPANTVAALRAELPDELRRRRRTERLRAWATGPLRPVRVVTAVGALAGLGAAALIVLAPGAMPAAAPNLLHEAQGHGPAVLPGKRGDLLPTPATTPVARASTRPSSGTATVSPDGAAVASASASAHAVTRRSASASAAPTVPPIVPTSTPAPRPTATTTSTPTTRPTPTTKPTPTSKPTPTASPTHPTSTPTPTRRPTAQPAPTP